MNDSIDLVKMHIDRNSTEWYDLRELLWKQSQEGKQ